MIWMTSVFSVRLLIVYVKDGKYILYVVSTERVPGGKKNDIWVPWVTYSLDVEMFVKG